MGVYSMKPRGKYIVAIILIGISTIPEVAAIEFTQEERERLAKGRVIVHLKTVRGPIKEGTAIGVIDAPPERVFKVVTDNENFEQFMPYVKQSEVDRIAAGSIINYQYLDFPLPIGDRYYKLHILRAVENTHRGRVFRSTWTYVKGSGNIKDTHGSCTLEEYDQGKTLVTYICCTDPGGYLPNWAVNMATKISLPNFIHRVRERVKHPKYGDQ
jgi:uncharacterized protein YndB with AHSA1/START domain